MVENAKIENSNATFWVIFKHRAWLAGARKCSKVVGLTLSSCNVNEASIFANSGATSFRQNFSKKSQNFTNGEKTRQSLYTFSR